MRVATLISWLLTASLGAFMLRTWLARGGLRRERARKEGLPPQLIFGHAAIALSGLALWTGYLATSTRALAWSAATALAVAICLGLCTVIVWTPYPARRPGERRARTPWDDPVPVIPDPPDSPVTDEMIVALMEGGFGRPRYPSVTLNAAVLVPVAHGFAAMATFALAVMTAST